MYTPATIDVIPTTARVLNFSPKAITPINTDNAGFKQSIKRYLRLPNRRKAAMAVQSPITTPKNAEIVNGNSGKLCVNILGTFCLVKSIIKKKEDAMIFLTRLREKADPRQLLSQIMNPSALESGENMAGNNPGGAAVLVMDVRNAPPCRFVAIWRADGEDCGGLCGCLLAL